MSALVLTGGRGRADPESHPGKRESHPGSGEPPPPPSDSPYIDNGYRNPSPPFGIEDPRPGNAVRTAPPITPLFQIRLYFLGIRSGTVFTFTLAHVAGSKG